MSESPIRDGLPVVCQSPQAEDDHDDLLAAAAAAVEAQQKEAVKAGRKKFGLLGRSAAVHKAAPRNSEDEQGHVVSSHTAKVCSCRHPTPVSRMDPISGRGVVGIVHSGFRVLRLGFTLTLTLNPK